MRSSDYFVARQTPLPLLLIPLLVPALLYSIILIVLASIGWLVMTIISWIAAHKTTWRR